MNRQEVKVVAIEMAREFGLINLSRRELCERAGIPDGSFLHTMGGTFSELVAELTKEGITTAATVVTKRRANPELRKETILAAGVSLAIELTYPKVTQDGVAERAGISPSLVSRYFGTMVQLHRDIIRYAIKNEVLEVIAQGLANGNKHALKASPELKVKAAQSLLATI